MRFCWFGPVSSRFSIIPLNGYSKWAARHGVRDIRKKQKTKQQVHEIAGQRGVKL